MESTQPEENKQKASAPKKAAKLPSKPISFSNHPAAKGGKQGGKATVNKNKKGGANLMRKLSGM